MHKNVIRQIQGFMNFFRSYRPYPAGTQPLIHRFQSHIGYGYHQLLAGLNGHERVSPQVWREGSILQDYVFQLLRHRSYRYETTQGFTMAFFSKVVNSGAADDQHRGAAGLRLPAPSFGYFRYCGFILNYNETPGFGI